MISIIIRRLTPESQIRILQVVIDNDYVEVALLLAVPDVIMVIISIITRWIVWRTTVFGTPSEYFPELGSIPLLHLRSCILL